MQKLDDASGVMCAPAKRVYDAGVQLGREHPKRWSASEAERLRHQLVRCLPEERIREAAVELAAETVKAWERFRAATSD